MRKLLKRFIFSVLVAVSAVVSVSLLWKTPLVLTLFLLGFSILTLLSHRDYATLWLYLFGAFFGAFAETLAIYFGAWRYTIPQFMGIPVWLIPLWGIAAVFLKEISNQARELAEKLE